MTIPFNKYQGTGNDFIIIDNRRRIFNPSDSRLINSLCDRRFGIGADGLILISDSCGIDYEMRYFNSDGNESTMCGNGGRCAAAFSFRHNIAGAEQRFLAADGIHRAVFSDDLIRLKMNDVSAIQTIDGEFFINTGSPHYVVFTKDVKMVDVASEGAKLRWSDRFAPGGTNVNFAEVREKGIFVRTFERGVENETLSCGTGVTASAIASVLTGHFDNGNVEVETPGGRLSVSLTVEGDVVKDIWLTGPATFVFEGKVEI